MASKHMPLVQETRTHIPTADAAHHLNRAQQTLLLWACGKRKGPVQPIRVNGRLAWPVADIKRVLGVEG
ncbi:MAG: DNA-binding protein [Comamonas sp.]